MHSLVLSFFAVFLPTVLLLEQKALDEFVNLSDPHYNYTFLKTEVLVYIAIPVNFDTINLTSQKWLDESEVDKPVWSHELTIVVPKLKTLSNSCLLIIRPGQNDELISRDHFSPINFISTTIEYQSIIALLRPVPSQPLTFYNHPLRRKNITGFDIVSYSWWRFIHDPTVPPHWLVQFPMVKATVRAMDTIIDYMKKKYRRDITRFTLAGVSLGGWITWLTAAVDKRVEGIVPIAMDFLNFTENFRHQYRAYCGWSYMLRPFYEMNITQELDNPRFSDLAFHVDPLEYNERYINIPKYMIVLSGDEVFQPDNSHYYFSQLEGPKYLQIIPNTDYRFQGKQRIMAYILSFYIKILDKIYRLPEVSWEIQMTNTSATILVRAYNTYQVYSYHADTIGNRRDFRMKIGAGNSSKDNPIKWIGSTAATVERNVYKAEISKPAERWRAFFLQVIYPAQKNNYNFIVTSEMLVLPDTFPCPDCSGGGCRGKLV